MIRIMHIHMIEISNIFIMIENRSKIIDRQVWIKTIIKVREIQGRINFKNIINMMINITISKETR